MIDLHTHLLPELDDGPPDDLASLEMARVAVENGITEMVATPHVREDHPAVGPDTIARALAAIQAELGSADVPLTVVAGGEVAIGPAVSLDDGTLRALTLGRAGTLLLETPHYPLPSIFEDVVTNLAERRGLRVLLAHPELSPDLQAEPERLGRLVERGALVQLTATSLAPGRRGRHRALARTALERGWAHVVASDSHSADWRPPDLEPAREAAGPLFDWLTREVPAALLRGEPVPERPVPAAAGGRRRWPAWRR